MAAFAQPGNLKHLIARTRAGGAGSEQAAGLLKVLAAKSVEIRRAINREGGFTIGRSHGVSQRRGAMPQQLLSARHFPCAGLRLAITRNSVRTSFDTWCGLVVTRIVERDLSLIRNQRARPCDET